MGWRGITENEMWEIFDNHYKDKFIYEPFVFTSICQRIQIECKKCGKKFGRAIRHHLDGKDCKRCANRSRVKKKTREQFINEAIEVNGGFYDYSKVVYISTDIKVEIGCPKHGYFWQIPDSHLNGNGCIKCMGEKLSKLFSSTTEEFIKKAKLKHGDRYDYTLVDYKNSFIDVKIICKIHGVFPQTPEKHLNGGCKECSKNCLRKTREQFIENSKIHHSDKYDYSMVNYINNITDVIIICPIHGEFPQIPVLHTTGSGCPCCNESKGERKIDSFLKSSELKYSREVYLDGCIYKSMLYFDFIVYKDSKKYAIEFQGKQHFIEVNFGSKKHKDPLEKVKIRDQIKRDYCKDRGILLLEIPYWDFEKVEELLKTFLGLNEAQCGVA